MDSKKLAIVIVLIAMIVSAILIVVILNNQNVPDTTPMDLPPEVSILNPEEDDILSGIVLVNVSVSDEENPTPDIYIDGILVASTSNYQWNTSEIPDGKHSIRVFVEDSAGQDDDVSIEVTTENFEEVLVPFSGILKIMAYNVKESGLNDDWKTVVKAENPDILVVVETGTWDDQSNEILNAAVSEFNQYFENENHYEAYCAQNSYFPTTGEAILSRFPIKDFIQIATVPLDDDSEYQVTHDFIDAVIDINGTDIHVIGTHLKASDGENNEYRRERETEGIINYMDNLGDVPIMYLGDLNSYSPTDVGSLAPQWDRTLGYGPLTMMLDSDNDTYGQYSSEIHNYTDIFRTLNPDDAGYTFGHRDAYTSIRIDYLIVNSFFDGMLLNSTVVDSVPADSASDHYAVTAFLNWTTIFL